MNDLLGRQCVITGATGELGGCIARVLWARGADLFLVARSAERLDRATRELGTRTNQRIHTYACDLSLPDAPAIVVDQVMAVLGNITVLVNNAAIQGPVGSVWENDWTEWERTLRVNLLAGVELSRRIVPYMAAAGRGKIINISGGGATAPRPRFSAYAVSKTALVRFSETLAREVGGTGIDVNCIAPGAFSSAMTTAVLEAGAECAGEREYQEAGRVRSQGQAVVERAAALCAFLASPASDGITGRLISAVWDPWETLAEHRDALQPTDVYTLRRIVPADRDLDWGER